MADMNSDSNISISPKKEEFQTTTSNITDSSVKDEVFHATPISICIPDNYYISYDNMVDIKKEEEDLSAIIVAEVSTDEKVGEEDLSAIIVAEVSTDEKVTETPSASKSSTSKRGRRPKPDPEWIGNWNVECKKRPSSERYDKIYRHKEQGFRCRSLIECERYEKHGIRSQTGGVKTKEKTESSNKSEEETNEEVVAKRRAEAENMRGAVEEFLAEAHYNQLHLSKP